MKKIVSMISAAILALSLMSSPASADPGPLDEHRGHYTTFENASEYGVASAEYHYHPIVYVNSVYWWYMADDEEYRPIMDTYGNVYLALESFGFGENDIGFYTDTVFKDDGAIEKWIVRDSREDVRILFDSTSVTIVNDAGTFKTELTTDKTRLVNGHYYVSLKRIAEAYSGFVLNPTEDGTVEAFL